MSASSSDGRSNGQNDRDLSMALSAATSFPVVFWRTSKKLASFLEVARCDPVSIAVVAAFLFIVIGPVVPYQSFAAAGISVTTTTTTTVVVLSTVGYDAIARKQMQVLLQSQSQQQQHQQYASSKIRFGSVLILNREEQRNDVRKKCGTAALERFDALNLRNQEHFASELWKYCAMSYTLAKKRKFGAAKGEVGVVYVDRSSPLIVGLRNVLVDASSSIPKSVAVINDPAYFPESVHGSLLYLRESHKYIAESMLSLLQTTPIPALEASPLLLQRTLYKLIMSNNYEDKVDATMKTDGSDGTENETGPGLGWTLLRQQCHQMDDLKRIEGKPSIDNHKVFTCPTSKSEFCCSAARLDLHEHEPLLQQVVQFHRHPVLPFQKITEEMPRPYNAENTLGYSEDELPYISTVRDVSYERDDDEEQQETKNLYEIFLEENLLPRIRCRRCLNIRRCTNHERYCQEYMDNVCEKAKNLPPKFVAKQITITPPLYRRDPSRLIPRVLHQTWYETLTEVDYPNMSRLVESFKQSGWEYKFYSDSDAELFLETHFPSEVLEAYRALIPGAFKADLFRYCALLIHGGVYADVDILLESKLDLAIEPDIGFMVPMDEVRLWLMI